MKYRKSMIMLVLAIFIFGVASVCASDANTAVAASVGGQATEIMDINEIESNDVVYDDSQILGLSNSNEILKEPATVTNHTFDAIQSAIDSGYDTIYLEPGTYTGTSEIGIDEKETVNIIGNSTILDAQGQTEIFLISNSKNVVIHNITFVNGNFEDGGAIMVFHSDNVQIIDCTFTNNTASVMGGAIMSTSANVQVINSTFTNNKANNNGGAIGWMISTVKVEGCIFTNNTAEGYSIVGGESSSVQITTSIFTKNSANAIVYFLGSSGTDISVNNNIFLNNNGTPINFDVSESNGEYNWFGHNQSNYKDSPGIKYCTKWLFLNATANPDTISVSDTSDITFTIWVFDSSNNNTNEYDKNLLKPVDLTITATNGNVSSDTAKFGDTVKYTATRGGTAGVTASIENAAYTIPLNVNKENPNLSIVDGEVPYAENTTLTLNYNSAATGKVNITLNGKKHNEIFDDMDLNSTINLEGILPDEYDVMVTYSGDDSFLNATASGKLTVLKLDSNITVESYDINVTDQDGIMFKVTLPKNATGNMTLSNGKTIDVTKEGKKGKKVLTVEIRNDAYPVGEYKWTFNYLGDDIYKNSTDQATSNILIIETKIIPKNKTIEMFCNDKSEVNYTTEPDDLKGITFKSSNTSVVTVNSKGIIKGVGEGKAHITLSFKGNENYTDCEASVTVTVSKIPTEIILNQTTLDLNVGDEANPGVGIIPSDAGELDYTSGDVSVVIIDGDGTFTAVAEGSANVTIAFYGNDKYAAAESKNITVTVSLKNASVVADPDSLELFVDEVGKFYTSTTPEDLDIKVSSSNESVATVKLVNRVPTVTAVGEGSAVITVTINEKDYVKNSTTVAVSVSKIPTNIELTEHSYSAYVNDTYDNLAVLQDNEGKNITDEYSLSYTSSNESVVKIVDNSFITVGEGVATITVSFNGTDKYEAAKDEEFKVDVFKIPTEIILYNDTFELEIGDEVNSGAIIDPVDAGELIYTSSDVSVVTVDENGIVTAVGEGNATVTVSFAGNDKYLPSNSTIAVTVSKIAFDPEITLNDTILTVEVPENATGNVTLLIGNETFVAPIENGVVSFDLSDVPAGDYNATLNYDGDDKYVGFEVVHPISIEENFIIIAEDLTKYFHGPERFAVNLTDREGNPIANANLTIYINGRQYNRTTDDNGQAFMAINLNSGEYRVVVTYNDTSVNGTVTVLPTVNGTDIVKMYRNGTQYWATFLDSEGNYLKDGEDVKFNINGVMYDRKVSGDKGLAKLNINLQPGEYIITATNIKTGENTANNITVISKIIENSDITKYFRNATQYTVKVIGDDGKAVGAGENVTFNINGVFYNRATNESGIAKLNINLQPGDYIITAKYKGCAVSNNIKVLPILNATDISMKYRDGTQFKATLVDGEGKPYADQNVTFNVNGVLYNRLTGSDGIAKLNINLMPGEYIITSSYNGTAIANKITIKS